MVKSQTAGPRFSPLHSARLVEHARPISQRQSTICEADAHFTEAMSTTRHQPRPKALLAPVRCWAAHVLARSALQNFNELVAHLALRFQISIEGIGHAQRVEVDCLERPPRFTRRELI